MNPSAYIYAEGFFFSPYFQRIVKIFCEIDKYFKLVTKALNSERKYRIIPEE